MRPDIYMIEIHRLADSPTQPRSEYHQVALQELAASIRTDGVLQPILARPITVRSLDMAPEHDLEIVAGHRRVRASALAELTEVPAIIRPLTDLEVMRIQAAENIQREDMSPLDEARALQQLIDAGERVKDVARDLGLSDRYVYARMQLLKVTGKALEALKLGVIGVELAVLIAQHSPMLHDCALDLIAPGGEPMSLRQARLTLKNNHLHRDLGLAPFPLALVLENATGCDNCAMNTTNMSTGAIEQLGIHQCTDPTCYTAKSVANAEAKLEHRKNLGWKVLDAAPEARQLIGGANIPGCQTLVDEQLAKTPWKVGLLSCWLTGVHVSEYVLKDDLPRFFNHQSTADNNATTAQGGAGEEEDAGDDETTVAAPKDKSHEQPVTLTPTKGEGDAGAKMLNRIVDAVLHGPVYPPVRSDLLMVGVVLADCSDRDIRVRVGVPGSWANAGVMYDTMAQWDDERLARSCVAMAIGLMTTTLPADRLPALIEQLAARYLPGEGDQISAVLTADEDHEDQTPDQGSGEEVIDEAGLAASTSSPVSTAVTDRFEAARIAGHAAGLADIHRGTPKYAKAALAAGAHPDSQEEHDWDIGWRAGQDDLTQKCQAAKQRGEEVGRSGAERMGAAYKAALREVGGDRYVRDPIGVAFDAGFAAARPGSASAAGKVKVRYMCKDTGQTWTGRGIKPRWLAEALASGRTLEEFEA